MTFSSPIRVGRQSAVRVFAHEYRDATLPEQGSGEYDPGYMVTRLGAKINRALIAGTIDSSERRESESGQSFRFNLIDVTGTHRVEVSPFNPELHPEAEEIHARFERGDRFIMMVVGKQRSFTTEDGGVFTSYNAQEMREIDSQAYVEWLAETADATLRRIDAYEKALSSEQSIAGFRAAGIPEDLVDGMLLSRAHYPDFESEVYMLDVLQALNAALGRSVEIVSRSPDPEPNSTATNETTAEVTEKRAEGDMSLEDVIISTIAAGDRGEGVDYDAIIRECSVHGHSRQDAEDAIDSLRAVGGRISEHKFGWFKLTEV
jgi:RPA family protein